MPTLASCVALLADASSLPRLAAVAAVVGCPEPIAPLDAEARRFLSVPDAFVPVGVARGPGTLRALLVETQSVATLREDLGRLAANLTQRAPHLLWIALATEAGGGDTVAIATWVADRAAPRVAALVAARRRILDSDAETLRALSAACGPVDVTTHARWNEVLGREALTRRFFKTMERSIRGMADGLAASAPATCHAERMDLSLLTVSRLLFLAFLEAKGWLNGDYDFLSRTFAQRMLEGGHYHRRFLIPLLFGTLNTPVRHRAPLARALGRIPFLNGGLFTRSALERRFPTAVHGDEDLGTVLTELIARHRFTAREGAATWSEAAVDPEMLGRAFETLMASDDRRQSGAFYTPHPIVVEVTTQALRHALSHVVGSDAIEAAVAPQPVVDLADRGAVANALRTLRVLDPACGSGAFLVHALDRLARLRMSDGDARSPSVLRREVLSNGIFGVDISPTAVWLCELRLWLAVVIDCDATDPLRAIPLPNLDHNIRVGDSLRGDAFDDSMPPVRARAAVTSLRHAYVRSTGTRKLTLARRLDRAERAAEMARLDRIVIRADGRRRELVSAVRARDLFGERHRPDVGTIAVLRSLRESVRAAHVARRRLASGGPLPFCWSAHFSDVESDGGFDIVIGNPPWVRLNRMPPSVRAHLRRHYRVFSDAREVASRAARSGGSGFADQVDLAAVFVERSLSLVRAGGIVAVLVPVKLWRALAGGSLRRLIAERADLHLVEDWSGAPAAFDAAVYPSLLVARRRRVASAPTAIRAARTMEASVRIRNSSIRWTLSPHALRLDDAPGSPWLLVPPAVRMAFDHLRAGGPPLAHSQFGRPRQGVKCGANHAFLVDLMHIAGTDAAVRAGGREGLVELAMLRPTLRGEGVRPWERAPSREYIVWTHDARGAVLQRLPSLADRWLSPARQLLEARADARSGSRWWSLFRVEGAALGRWRVVWPDMAREPRALVLEPGDPVVPLNSCYVVSVRSRVDALALATLLNSPLTAAFLNVVAEPARGGFRRYLAWTAGLLPLPHDWSRARGRLAAVAARAVAGEPVTPVDLVEVALRAYAVSRDSMAPLLEWCAK
ncbi:MAG: hypothetical protein NVS1B4_03040 [Gemmatimonadaceae bacterium]